MKTILTILLLCGTTLLNAQVPTKNQVHRIYVEELQFRNNPDSGGFIRSKLISSLAQACRPNCTIVDSGDDNADAVLTGTVLVETPDNRHYRVQGAMRLVDKDGNVLWAATIFSSRFARSATSSFADNTAKELVSFLSSSSEESSRK
jgi:hypothetical protein